VSWVWWDWSLTWSISHRPSVLCHCWLGHVTRKIILEMTYIVWTGTLNKPCYTVLYCLSVCVCVDILWPLLVQHCTSTTHWSRQTGPRLQSLFCLSCNSVHHEHVVVGNRHWSHPACYYLTSSVFVDTLLWQLLFVLLQRGTVIMQWVVYRRSANIHSVNHVTLMCIGLFNWL